MSADLEWENERIRRVQAAEFTDLQMGILTGVEARPGEVPINHGLGEPRKVVEEYLDAFTPLFMSGLIQMTVDKMMVLSEEGQELLNKARETRSKAREVQV